jgi:predicted nucleotidyltransferase component of viral defense system
MPHIPEEEAIRAVLQALSLDDFLQEQFVLKGGNALKFAFDSPRSSVDVDLSSTEPYPNQEDQETRLYPSIAMRRWCCRAARLSRPIFHSGNSRLWR